LHPTVTPRLPAGKVWDTATGREAWGISHPGLVTRLTFSPDGQRLATAGGDGTARIWNAATGQELLVLHGHAARVNAVVYYPDGKSLATASDDQTARVWDTADGKPLRVYRGHTAPLLSVAVSLDGRLLATASADSSVRIWDATQDPEAQSLSFPHEQVGSLAFAPQGDQLAVGAFGFTVLDLSTLRLVGDFRKKGGENTATAVAYGDGGRLVSVAISPLSRAFNFQCAVAVRDPGEKERGWTTAGVPVALALRPDGRQLALATDQKPEVLPLGAGKVEVWDLDTRRLSFALDIGKARVAALAYRPDGRRLAVAEQSVVAGRSSCQVIVRDSSGSGAMVLALPEVEDTLLTLAFGPHGRDLLAVGSKRVYRWDAETGQGASGFSLNAPLRQAAVSPDGQRLATAGEGGRVALWDLASGQILLELGAFAIETTALAFSPDGTRLAAAALERQGSVVKIWDARPRAGAR
jgi:WD40 repeat protein